MLWEYTWINDQVTVIFFVYLNMGETPVDGRLLSQDE